MRVWTEKEKKLQACAIRRWKPWKKSTGPRTSKGKDKSRYNALKHGHRSAEIRELYRVLGLQRRYVRSISKSNPTPTPPKRANELLYPRPRHARFGPKARKIPPLPPDV